MFEDFAPITDALTAFVQTFGEEYTCKLSADFGADHIKDVIHYAFVMPDTGARSFRANFVACYPIAADFDIFTLSFLHELGHLETSYEMINDQADRDRIHDLLKTDPEQAYREYFALYNERIATEWAAQLLMDEYEMLKAWEKKILEMFRKVLDKYPD